MKYGIYVCLTKLNHATEAPELRSEHECCFLAFKVDLLQLPSLLFQRIHHDLSTVHLFRRTLESTLESILFHKDVRFGLVGRPTLRAGVERVFLLEVRALRSVHSQDSCGHAGLDFSAVKQLLSDR